MWAQLPQKQPRALTEQWHRVLGPSLLGAPHQDRHCVSPPGADRWEQNTRDFFQGSRRKEDIFAFSPWWDLKQKYQISTLTAHGSYGTRNKSYASTPDLPNLSCAQVEAWSEPSSGPHSAEGCQEDSYFKTGLFFPFGRHCKKMSIFKFFFSGLISKFGKLLCILERNSCWCQSSFVNYCCSQAQSLTQSSILSGEQSLKPCIAVPRAPPRGLPGQGSLPQKLQ